MIDARGELEVETRLKLVLEILETVIDGVAD